MRLFTAVCLLLLSVLSFAQSPPNYFQAIVPVHSQSAEDRKFAAQRGMQEVIVRMSASESVLLNDDVQAGIGRAQRYLEQYQFRRIDDAEMRERGYKEEMHLSFSPSLIQALLLQKARVRYWAEGNRPQILVWLVEDNPDLGKQLINTASVDLDGEAHPLASALKLAANERGLPIEYPILDLEDQMAISGEDVWRLSEEKIRSASERYAAPVILVGRYSTTSRGELWSTWQYYHLGYSQTWDSRASEVDKFAWEALSPLNDFLAERYAIYPSAEGSESALVLHLNGVNTFKQFRAALDYFNGLAMVSDVKVIEAREGELLLALDSEANVERFKSSVQLGRKLEFVAQTEEVPAWLQLPQGSYDNPLRYSWRGI